jgi:hypothetical protein
MAVAGFANPLAVMVAGVFLVAQYISEPELRPTTHRLLLFLSPFIVARVLFGLIFWEPASYMFRPVEIIVDVLFGVIGAIVARESLDPKRRSKETLFLTFAAVAVASFVVPHNPVGGNVGRFFFIFGVPLLLSIRDVALPKGVAAPLIVLIACGQLFTPAMHYVHIARLPSTRAEFFTPALVFANEHRDLDYRSHVVALDTHWEAYYFSINHLPITRGWYRQDDALHNDVLRQNDFTAREYVSWLRDMGVKYVYLPHAPLDMSGERETEILSTSRQFTVVLVSPEWTIFRLKEPEPMIVPGRRAGTGHITAIDHQSVTLQVTRPGVYLIKVSYSPYWEITAGEGHLREGRNGFLVLRADAAGLYGIRVNVTLESSWRHFVTAL